MVHFRYRTSKIGAISRNLAVARVHVYQRNQNLQPSSLAIRKGMRKDTAYDSGTESSATSPGSGDSMADKNGAPAGKRPRDVAGDHALAELLDRLLGARISRIRSPVSRRPEPHCFLSCSVIRLFFSLSSISFCLLHCLRRNEKRRQV